MKSLLVALLSLHAVSATAPNVMLNTLSEELHRNFEVLKVKADPAPYFISYEVTEQDFHMLGGTLGAINANTRTRNRFLDVSVRVGSPKLDNYHRVRGERTQFTSGAQIAIDDNPNAIKQRVWLETDRTYRAAAERLIKIATNQQVKVADRDASNDFSQESPSRLIEPVKEVKFPVDQWAGRIRRLSLAFAKYPAVLTSGVYVLMQEDTRYFVNTDGSRLQHGRGYARLVISAQAKAADGMDLSDGETFEALDTGALPKDDVLLAAIDRVAANIKGLLAAPVAEPFVGPAIFAGRASGVFFHEIFGHRIEGHRQKDEAEGQTFTHSVGEKVLPDFLSVVMDPTRRQAAGRDLNGWYTFDDEGVPGQAVRVVDKGILRSFLMSRSPIEGFNQSNGHGRRQPGLEVVSRQSNLLVESSRAVSDARLRELLIEEVRKQGKPYGLYFQDITGGYTTTGRSGLQAFKVIPVIVYRVYADGRPDELIRGADIVGTPLASFGKILETSTRFEVFNGYCGAESGNVPVSAVAPAILISEIEIEKKDKSQDRPPLLPSPVDITAVSSESGVAR
ncbi:MAG: metallopeptidase TldD-related protein [Acidobacteriota bacterium]|nr:metallopeptidase TldD-related protein [Acidobacteriota bacterium]